MTDMLMMKEVISSTMDSNTLLMILICINAIILVISFVNGINNRKIINMMKKNKVVTIKDLEDMTISIMNHINSKIEKIRDNNRRSIISKRNSKVKLDKDDISNTDKEIRESIEEAKRYIDDSFKDIIEEVNSFKDSYINSINDKDVHIAKCSFSDLFKKVNKIESTLDDIDTSITNGDLFENIVSYIDEHMDLSDIEDDIDSIKDKLDSIEDSIDTIEDIVRNIETDIIEG